MKFTFLASLVDLKPLQPLFVVKILGGVSPTTNSGRSGFRSTRKTAAYRYDTIILNFMANPIIYCDIYKYPYISLYLESPHPSLQAWAACGIYCPLRQTTS